ncbi:LPS export ABC transporter periplasmic protein LptC [Sphingomonas koreensis]|nr:LPS export ABC transporter periplasmic protein LptC [Sphingomonas koreensis]TPG41353.1 LPS export ABC transporter periplasmic protein LptC [Sphingomonas koreensis]
MSDAARGMRTARQIWAAPGGRHDRLIGFLGFALPVAIGILAAFLVMAPLTRSGDASFLLAKDNVAIAHDRLKIEAATYRGEDSVGRPFELRAGSALQKSSAEPIVRLNALSASLGLTDGPANIVANQGHYNMDNEQVTLDGPIKFRAANGYKLDTNDATLDLKTRKMRSAGAVTGVVPQGSFSANHMSADLDSHSVSLDGNARLRIVPGRTK